MDKSDQASLPCQAADGLLCGVDFLLGHCNWDHDSSNGKALGWEKNGLVKVRVDALDPALWGVGRWGEGWLGGGGEALIFVPA